MVADSLMSAERFRSLVVLALVVLVLDLARCLALSRPIGFRPRDVESISRSGPRNGFCPRGTE